MVSITLMFCARERPVEYVFLFIISQSVPWHPNERSLDKKYLSLSTRLLVDAHSSLDTLPSTVSFPHLGNLTGYIFSFHSGSSVILNGSRSTSLERYFCGSGGEIFRYELMRPVGVPSHETVEGDRAMTLVIAFVGEAGAVMAGDMREITFLGDRASMDRLERELYTGSILTDEDLGKRAGALGVRLGIRDDKVKVTERDGVLVGEVTSLEGGVLRKRRVYASGGSYAIVDTGDGAPVPRGRGGAGNFVVLGNEKTKAIAHRCIRERWKNGGLRDAVEIIARSMERASAETPSVSRRFILVQTGKTADLGKVMEQEGTGSPS
jgi:hypothetical protein